MDDIYNGKNVVLVDSNNPWYLNLDTSNNVTVTTVPEKKHNIELIILLIIIIGMLYVYL